MSKNQKVEPSIMMVSLDTLLDTRFACFHDKSDDELKAIIEMYHDRLIDEFPGMSLETFQTLYDNRTKEVLKHAMVTPIAFFVKEFCQETIKNNLSGPIKLEPKICVNIHPYKLDEEEQNNIINIVKIMVSYLADVFIIDRSYEELTPAFVKTNFSVMVMYDYYKWLEIHSKNENFKKTLCSNVAMFVPAIYFKKQENFSNYQEVMEAVVKMTAPFISLCLRPVEDFSLLRLSPPKSGSEQKQKI